MIHKLKGLGMKKVIFPLILLVVFSAITCFVENIDVFAEGSDPRIKRLVSQLYEKKDAMDAQRKLLSYGSEVVEYVVPLLKDQTNTRARIAALNIIGQNGSSLQEDSVIVLLSDRDRRIRKESAKALSSIGTAKSVEPLKALVSDFDPGVRYYTIKALSKIAPASDSEYFIKALGDFDPRVRKYAVVALGDLKVKEAVPYFRQMVNDFDPAVRMELAIALGKIGTVDSLEPILILANDPEANIRLLAIESLGTTKGKEADGYLLRAVKATDPKIASEAILFLARRNQPQALEIAKQMLKDEHMDVRLACIEVIGIRGGVSEKSILNEMLVAESTLVRRKAQEALDTINAGK
jgi:HEAT repeat protein